MVVRLCFFVACWGTAMASPYTGQRGLGNWTETTDITDITEITD